jgi:hypothetical protein
VLPRRPWCAAAAHGSDELHAGRGQLGARRLDVVDLEPGDGAGREVPVVGLIGREDLDVAAVVGEGEHDLPAALELDAQPEHVAEEGGGLGEVLRARPEPGEARGP